MKRLNGITLPFRKITDMKPIQPIGTPRYVRLPMLMHKGTPCVPAVSEGEHVAVGQVIGRAEDAQAAPIHASVSGTVTALTEFTAEDGSAVPCVEIRADRDQVLSPDCKPPKAETKAEFIAAVQASGGVGLSGAGVPTAQKLAAADSFDILIVNGAECDPALSADCRLMTETPQDVLDGISWIMKMLKIREVRIGIMKDKIAAIKTMSDLCSTQKGITVCPLPAVYPQGAEKVVVFHTCGRIIPEDQTAADLHILVLNVSTCAFIGQYMQTGIPLIERTVTVTGSAVRKPGNYRVPVGTPVMNVLDAAGCELETVNMLLNGGMMMGSCITDLNAPVLRQQNGLVAMKKYRPPKKSPCIRCGRCMQVCPMGLMPLKLEEAYEKQDLQALRKLHVSLCMNCGCCSYICPAHRPLAATNLLAKAILPENAEGEQK
ncbi:MAG: RnfABCDGE type electron transport complex subunit C [Oscillospiraceae bacterium]|nr:RnfABCDGE type electron transport complex subunit C [Oscillospiraceae bacterium]